MAEDAARLDAVFQALSHSGRRDMLARLAQGDLTVSELARPLAMSLAAASKHVKALEKAGLVRRTIKGRRHVCSLHPTPLASAAEWLRFYQRHRAGTSEQDAGTAPEPVVERLRRTIYARPDLVYRAWLEADVLRHWLAPAGFTVLNVEIDERVGGRYRVWQMRAAGDVACFDCELTELVRNERIVLRWRTAEGHGDPDSQMTITLRRASADATRVSLLHEHPRREPDAGTAEPPEATEHVPREDLDEIWSRYKLSADRGLRDRLILTYAPLVRYVAGKLGAWLPPHVEQGDLISYGLLGLIGAIERFEPERDTKFETYAISRIRGAMIDELRSLDWVPRAVRNRARDVERAMTELKNRPKRTPSDEEIAAELGISLDELRKSLDQIARSSVFALDELWSGSGAGSESTALIDTFEDPHAPDPARELLQGDMRQALADAITRLPDRERLVMTLYYYEELTLREIAEVLSVDEPRVSQLHTKAILRLRARLGYAQVRRDDGEGGSRTPPSPGPAATPQPAFRPPSLRSAPVGGAAGSPDQDWRQALNRLAATLAEV